MIDIETKKMPSGKWSSYVTIQGYDHAFVTDSESESQSQMKEQLKKSGIKGNFLPSVIHPPYSKKLKYKWSLPFLDHLN